MELNGEATPVTWETIRDVVKGPYVQNNDLAVKIYQSLKEESTRQQIVTREYKIYSLPRYSNRSTCERFQTYC